MEEAARGHAERKPEKQKEDKMLTAQANWAEERLVSAPCERHDGKMSAQKFHEIVVLA